MRPLGAVDEIIDTEYFTTVLNITETAYNTEVITLKTSIHHLNESFSSSSPSSPSPQPTLRSKHSHLGLSRGPSTADRSATFAHYEELVQRFLKDAENELVLANDKPKTNRFSAKLSKSQSQKPRDRDHDRDEVTNSQPRSCMCCCETFPCQEYRVLQCGHVCCVSCLTQMILPSIKEEAKLPPRCCAIPMSGAVIESTLTKQQLSDFLKAVYIAVTPVACRVWCPKPTCSEFTALEPEDLRARTTVSCWACDTVICTLCKQYEHCRGERCCAVSLEPPVILDMMYKYGWRQCIRCHCLLELKEGCRQVRCSCGAFFCYICMEPGQCKNGCSLARLDRYRHQAEVARKRDANNLAAKDAELATWTAQNPLFATLEKQSRAELDRFYSYYTRQLGLMHQRHEQLMRQSLAAKGAKDITFLDSVIERHNRIIVSIEDAHVRQEARLIQQQSAKEATLKNQIERLQKHWNSVISSSQRHNTDLKERINAFDRLRRHHILEIDSLRDTQQRIQDALGERLDKERKAAAEKQQGHEKRAANRITREENIFRTAFHRRLENLWKLWELRWEEARLQLRQQREDNKTEYARFRPSWLHDGDCPAVGFLVSELHSVLVACYGKETADRLAAAATGVAGQEEEEDRVSVWEWEEEDDEDIDYHDFVRPWKKARKTSGRSLGLRQR